MLTLKVTVKKTFRNKGGEIFEIGERVTCTPINNGAFLIENNEKQCRMPYRMAHRYLTKFKKEPSLKTLEKHSWEGVSTTPLGEKVEIDGNDKYGFPSWMQIRLFS